MGGAGLPPLKHCVSKALLFQQPGFGVMTLYVYYCIIIVYIDSLTSKTPLASFHKMLVRENSNEPCKTLLAEAIFVCQGTSKLLWVCSYGLFLSLFSPSVLWLFPLLPPYFFLPVWHLLASHQATEYLVAFFRREGDNQVKTSSQIHPTGLITVWASGRDGNRNLRTIAFKFPVLNYSQATSETA